MDIRSIDFSRTPDEEKIAYREIVRRMKSAEGKAALAMIESEAPKGVVFEAVDVQQETPNKYLMIREVPPEH